MTSQQALSSALTAITTAGAAALAGAGKDAQSSLAAAQAYVAQLAPDAEQLLSGAADAAARGEDIGTWSAGVLSLTQAAALRTVSILGDLAEAEAARLVDVANGALHTLIALAPVLLAAV